MFRSKKFTGARFNVTAVFLRFVSCLPGYDAMSLGVQSPNFPKIFAFTSRFRESNDC